MSTANINDLRLHNARNFIEALHGPEGEYRGYVFLGRTSPWEVDNQTNEELPPAPSSSVQEFFRTCNEMVSIQAIQSDDVFFMIRKVKWESGSVYDLYRHDYSQLRTSYSNAKNLWDASFYVINQNNIVYVCLDNNNDNPSTVEPQGDTSDPFYTSDGYLWLKIYTLSVQDAFYHSTDRYVPVTTDSYISSPVGAVYTVKIDVAGDSFTTNPLGVNNQVPYYYCRILGDGQGAVARIAINNQSVSEVVVVRPGQGYTYGYVDFTANNSYSNLIDLDQNKNALDPLGDGTFKSQVIISPQGGWGYNDDPLLTEEENLKKAEFAIARQLGASRVGVFSTLNYNLSEFAKEISFRQLGILQDPEFIASAGVNLNTASTAYQIKIINNNFNTNYIVGETIRQVHTFLETGEPDKYAIGKVIEWDKVTSVLKYIQVPEIHSDIDGNLYRFKGDNYIEGMQSGKIEYADTGFSLAVDGVVFFEGYAEPQVKDYSGLITYLTNIKPIQRQPSQSEKISFIISY